MYVTYLPPPRPQSFLPILKLGITLIHNRIYKAKTKKKKGKHAAVTLSTPTYSRLNAFIAKKKKYVFFGRR